MKFDRYGQSGALSQSFSDVFAVLIKQNRGGISEEEYWVLAPGVGTWLAGQDPRVKRSREPYRSMMAPGMAFRNDPILGNDPQIAHYSNLYTGDADNGGIHINSGVPNKAFYECSQAIGTDKAGEIWYQALLKLGSKSDFRHAAAATVENAGKVYGPNSPEKQAVQKSWKTVGVFGDSFQSEQISPLLEKKTRAHFEAWKEGDEEKVLAFYDFPMSRFFSKSNATRKFVENQLNTDLSGWSDRSGEILSMNRVDEPSASGEDRIQFVFRGELTESVSTTEIAWKNINGVWKIRRIFDLELPPSAAQMAVVESSDNYANVRTGPGSNYDVITRVQSGEKFHYIKLDNMEWWPVWTKEGKRGFIFKKLIRPTT